MKILVSGAAGFIGFHLSKRLLERGDEVVGLDNLSNYYDVNLKKDRLKQFDDLPNFKILQMGLEDRAGIKRLFAEEGFDKVVNLAAQAGVRHSIKNPHTYINSNIVGFLNILEACCHNNVKHLVYASSSSVYGANTNMPFSVNQNVDHPVSLYAATKKSNELMAHTYSSLYGLPTTGLRFFTVYGPWGRPDMAYFSFTKAILEGKPIDIYNNGKMKRDFTYIDDVVEGVMRIIDKIAAPNVGWNACDPDPGTSYSPYRIYNIGNNSPVELMYFVETLEKCLGKKANKNLLPMQAGDVPATCADVDDLMQSVAFRPTTQIEDGIDQFVKWYLEYYQPKLVQVSENEKSWSETS
jgi:UDP-glucuronate 4-epimerase